MFSRELDSLTLTSNIADELFPNICGSKFSNDSTFLATLRAILAHRMTGDDTLWLDVRVGSNRSFNVSNLSDIEIFNSLVGEVENNTILVYGINGTESWNNTVMQSLERVFDGLKNFVGLKDIGIFVQRTANATIRVYIDETNRSVVIFVADLNIKLWHYIQSFIPRYFPWYFKEQHLTEEEKQLAKATTLRTARSYEQLIEEFASKYDFRSKKIDKLLGGFEAVAKKVRLRTVDSSLSETESNIDRNVRQYRDYIRMRDQLMIERAGLIAMINGESGESEIAEYFKCNRLLNPVSVENSQLSFIVSCYLENFDVEMYQRISMNFNGYMYRDYEATNDVFVDPKVRKKFMDAIFSDEPLLKVKLCAYYYIDLSGYVGTESGYPYPVEYADRIPNPHLQRHSCLGNQRPLIEEYLRNRNYIAAIEQCVCSAGSINVGESATFPYLLKALFASSAKKVIELPDGTSCTPEEALKWLESQENNNTEVVE